MPSSRARAEIATTAVTIIPVVEPRRCSVDALTADGGYTVLYPRSRLSLVVTAGQGIRVPDTARVTAEAQWCSPLASAVWMALPRAMKVGAHRPT